MLKSLKIYVLTGIVMLNLSSSALAADSIPINDLIEKSVKYSGQEVTVEGEALGEVLERGDYAWVNISDGGNAIGIWMTLDDAMKIENFGDYKNVGDTIKVAGVFSRNCAEHGGDVDIHCRSLNIVSVGHPVIEILSQTKVIVTIVAVLVAGIALVFYFFKLKKVTK